MARSNIITEGRRLNDLGLALAESIHEAGGCDEDIRRVLGDKLLKARLGLLVMGKLKFEQTPSQMLAADLIPEGWEIIEDVEPTDGEIELVTFLEEGDGSYVSGTVMRERAVKLSANLGLADGKQLLDGKQEKLQNVPHDKVVVLTGTLLRDQDGGLRVAFLVWGGGRWVMGFYRFGRGWDGYCRLARRK